jgi:molybdate transport system permease protein
MTLDPFPLYLTVRISVCATVLVILMGTPLAWTLARKQFWGKHLVDALVMQPMVIPPTVLGYYLLVLFGRRSPLGRFLEDYFDLQLVFTWRGAVIAATVAALPLFVKPARAAIEGVDVAFEDVARLLGRSEWSVIRTVTLPLAWRGLVAGTVMAFTRAMGEFGTTLMVMGNVPGKLQTVSIAIYDASQSIESADRMKANVLVAIVTVFSITVLWCVSRLTRGKI